MKNPDKVFARVKTTEKIAQERKPTFEEEYLQELNQQYEQILAGFSDKNRPEKERIIKETFGTLNERLLGQEDFIFNTIQKTILKTKLARHFQHNETIDTNTLFDAIIESPKFVNNDKGSLHRLLEVHEQKTLLKIAEMRKKRAEMTGEKGLNPYEALFTTKSGKYYLARLLNMPHLEKESEYMKHCVGTSDSYVSRIKKGEIEIFSFRKLEGDAPLLTIEYNLKTGTIEQIRKKNDKYLYQTDPLLGDTLDALKQLRATKNDQGRPREINKINPSEIKDINLKPGHLLTGQGEVHFRNLNEKDPFILKTGEIKLTSDITHKDAAKLLRIFEHLEFKPEQIVRQPNEINKNTKAYVGKLEPAIFNKIQQYNIEYIYTQFPESRVKIERDFEAGPITLEEFERKSEKYNRTVTDESRKIEIGSISEYIMQSKDFATLKSPEQMSLVHLNVHKLGFKSNVTSEQIYGRAQELGLELCPPEVGPYKRLLDTDRPIGERYLIAMKQITTLDGQQYIFGLDHNRYGLWLETVYDFYRHNWSPATKFVFRLPSLKRDTADAVLSSSHKSTEGKRN